jgi:hypothetical protein
MWMMYWNTSLEQRSGTFTSIGSNWGGGGVVVEQSGILYMRFEYDSTTGFRMHLSPDGLSWNAYSWIANPLGGAPTHMGLGHTTWGGTSPFIVSREYFRVNP